MMKNNNKGVAMIVAVVMALVFFMLVLTVSVLSTSAYKRSHFYKDRAIALNLAEAGLADALYRMNYKDYGAGAGHLYPWGDGAADNPDTVNDPFGTGSGSYIIELTDAGANADILKATGIYKGRRRTIQVKIRGDNAIGDDLNKVDNGIAEAFNKHVIYAGVVSGTGTAITGNIARMTIANIASATGNYTVTTVPSTQFGVASPDDPEPGGLPTPAWDVTYTDGDWGGGGSPYDFNTDYPGSIYDDGAGTYTFALGLAISNSPRLDWSGGNATVNIRNTDSLSAGKGIGTDGSINLPNGGSITLGAGSYFVAPNGVDATGTTITSGDLIVESGLLTLNNTTVNSGAVLSDNSITFPAGTASTINVPDTSGRKAAIILRSTGALTVTITTAPTITFGANPTNQKAAIILYSTGGNATLNLQNPITWHSSIPIDRRSAIVYTDSGKAEVTVSNGFDGLLYANGTGGAAGDYGEINLNDGIVNGALVAGGDPGAGNNNVNLTAGTLTWDKRNYTDTSSIFQNFSGGRRVYLLVPGSWKEE